MLCFLTLSAVLIQAAYGDKFKINAPELVIEINKNAETWQAHDYGQSIVDLALIKASKLGLRKGEHGSLGFRYSKSQPVPTSFETSVNASAGEKLPENFSWVTAKDKNYGCPIGEIRDQSRCGSCWAVSTASAFSDRVCIASKGKFKTPLSSNNLAGCETESYGCYGGYMDSAHEYLVKEGLITGGEYESDTGCQPYSIRPCGGPNLFHCSRQYYMNTPKCNNKCTNEWYHTKRETKTTKASKWYVLPMNEVEIMKNIYEKGPVTAGFLVQFDFIFYKKGIYIPNPRSWVLGGHAVRVVGWGVEDGIKYWHVANSWGTEWGEDGYFRIIRGKNAVGFEEEITTADP